MASLSDLISGGGSGAPDAAATLIKKVHATKGTYFYEPDSPLAPGKYVVKADYAGPANIHVNAHMAEVDGWNDNVAVIELPEPSSHLQVTVEAREAALTQHRREIRRFYPGGISTGNNGSSNPFTGSTMIANTADGKVWIQVNGYQSVVRRSVDGGRTWQDLGRHDYVGGDSNTYYESYTINYFKNRFIYAAGPTETGTSATSANGFSWTRVSTNLTTVTTSTSSPDCYVAGRRTTSNNLVYSFDGVNFYQTSASGFTGNVLRVFWTGTQFLAFDDGGRMTTSTNGRDWTTAITIPFTLRDITLLNGVFFAVSNTGIIYSSTNLSTWTATSTQSTSTNQNHQIKTIESENLLAYYDPNNGRISTSPDGITWTIRVTGLNQYGTLNSNLGKMTKDGDAVQILSYMQNSSTWYKTVDGVDWMWREQPAGTSTGFLSDIAYGAGLFVATSQDSAGISTSVNGINWTSRTSNTGQVIRACRYLNNQFVRVGNSGEIGTSADGINWTSRITNAMSDNNIHEVYYGNGKWIAVGNTSAIFTYSTDDAVTWTNGSWSTGAAMYGVAWGDVDAQTYADGVWVAVGDSGVIMRSIDNGVNWTRVDNVYPNTKRYKGDWQTFTFAWRDVEYADGKFVAVGDRVIGWSEDGLNWVIRDIYHYHRVNVWNGVRWDEVKNRWVAYGDSGLAAYSTDGITWFSLPTGLSTSYSVGAFAVDPVNEIWLFGGSSGQVRDSKDGEYWFHYQSDFSPVGTGHGSYYGKHEDGKYGHLMSNTSGIWRTDDWDNWYEPMYNNLGGANYLLQILYGDSIWLAKSNSSEAIYWSENGRNWAVIESGDDVTDVRGYNITYADGYFWKIYRAQLYPNRDGASQARLSRSSDGKIWYDYTGWRNSTGTQQQAYFPVWFKKVKSGYVAFGYSSGGDGRYYHFSRDLLTRPDSWETGDTGQTGSGWTLTDIEETSWITVFGYGNNNSVYAATIGGNASGTAGAFLIYNADGAGTFGFYRAWRAGDRLFCQNGSNLYELNKSYSSNVATNTNFERRVFARYAGTWGQDQQNMTIPNGNAAWATYSNNHFTMHTGIPTTISIYNSTIEIENQG